MENQKIALITKLKHFKYVTDRSDYAKSRVEYYKREVKKGMKEEKAVSETKEELARFFGGIDKRNLLYD